MKLIQADFKNFRLLRNMKLKFSTDNEKKLTVIRAENETGKTTLLVGLQWALYGDIALPNKGKDYRLHPVDWKETNGEKVPISVEVEFEAKKIRKSKRGLIESLHVYRITRTALEVVEGDNWQRISSNVSLYERTDKGDKMIEHPISTISDVLPPELLDVFFTDGDRALSFVEASTSAKRDKVQKAIRSLLGLEVIESALYHVQRTASSVNKEVQKISSDSELINTTKLLETIQNDEQTLLEEIKDAKEQQINFNEKLKDVRKSIDEILVKGDREKLKNDITETVKQIDILDKQLDKLRKEHSNLFRNLEFSRDLLDPVLEKGLNLLDKLRNQGEIPKTTIPILEERLNKTTCICGESLDEKDPDGAKRRLHIQHLIGESAKADELKAVMTDLYFGSRSLRIEQVSGQEEWSTLYARISEQRDELDLLRTEKGTHLNSLKIEIDEIPDNDIQGLRENERLYENKCREYSEIRIRSETKLQGILETKIKLSKKRDNLLKEQSKGNNILAELIVTQDVEHVLKKSYDRITKEELTKVSKIMNSIFLKMIGSDPKQGSMIQSTKIDDKFDILVFGPNSRPLEPDQDLNGASRRALTIAFILALTKVSNVEAPNVIDTPLGMMSGFVKRSVLRTAIEESSQLLLLLTRSEVSGCEDILEKNLGCVVTLTNTKHYPKMLVNDPKIVEETVITCECGPRQECEICKRKID